MKTLCQSSALNIGFLLRGPKTLGVKFRLSKSKVRFLFVFRSLTLERADWPSGRFCLHGFSCTLCQRRCVKKTDGGPRRPNLLEPAEIRVPRLITVPGACDVDYHSALRRPKRCVDRVSSVNKQKCDRVLILLQRKTISAESSC